MSDPKPLPKPEEVADDVSRAVEGDGAYEVPSDDAPMVGSAAADDAASSSAVVLQSDFGEFADDCLQLMSVQAVLLSFLLFAVLLNLGASLWLSFSDKWRS